MTTTLPRWTTIAANDRVAGAPITGWLMSALDDNLEHARRVCYDPEIHTAATAHDHDGVNSAHLSSYCGTPSLLRYGLVSSTAAQFVSALANRKSGWAIHGAELVANGWSFGAENQWVSAVLVDADRPPFSRTTFGAGTDLVVSCYVQATGTLTTGAMAFGLVDGGSETDDDTKTFVSGTKAIIPYSIVPVSTATPAWVRVWARLPDIAGEFETSCRVCVQCDETPTGGAFVVNAIDVRPGRALDFWTQGYHTDGYLDWAMYGSYGPPLLDQSIALTNAILSAPVES